MRRVLAGLDTEYGFSVEGRGAEDQVDDATALVRSYPGECFPFWDDRFESPRHDLRGFRLERLSFDPQDAKYDEGRSYGPINEVRADRVLANGARLYNDHGHPEYATPETLSLEELALHDAAGDMVVCAAAEAFARKCGRAVSVFKNNTDFHGASYGCHESYLVPRSLPVANLVAGLMPLFIARQVLCGAGKVGAESGKKCDFQMSQRADFAVEPINAETLFRRPLFNTRDEPHADPGKWIRLHVICGDANMSPTALKLKVGLIKAALHLIESGDQPIWRLANPVNSFQSVSRSPDGEGRIDLEGGSWTTPRQVLESYIEPFLSCRGSDDAELAAVLEVARELLDARFGNHERFARSVDWAAKRRLLSQFAESEGLAWSDPSLQSLDLEYHRLDGEGGLYRALAEQGEVDSLDEGAGERQAKVFEPTRARARSLAVTKFRDRLKNASWGTLTFETESGERTVALAPERDYPETLAGCTTVEELIMELE